MIRLARAALALGLKRVAAAAAFPVTRLVTAATGFGATKLITVALALGLMPTGASAFDLTEERFDARIGGRAVPVTARLAEEGLGYSVVQGRPDRRGRYLVHVTCREGRHARAACPTPVYAASCPTARISCR